MHTKNFIINQGGNGKAVEAVTKGFPEFEIISSLA